MFGLTDWLWDWRQQKQIFKTSQHLNATQEKITSQHVNIQTLEARVERLMLANAAMWKLVSEQLGINDEDLATAIKDVDLLDGKLDGKLKTSAKTCTSCNRVSNARRPTCLYCGADLEKASPFDI